MPVPCAQGQGLGPPSQTTEPLFMLATPGPLPSEPSTPKPKTAQAHPTHSRAHSTDGETETERQVPDRSKVGAETVETSRQRACLPVPAPTRVP